MSCESIAPLQRVRVGYLSLYLFFFQAEDGMRDIGVTGVQTCAHPISRSPERARPRAKRRTASETAALSSSTTRSPGQAGRSFCDRPTALRNALLRKAKRPSVSARDRKSVVLGKGVDLGGSRIINKKKT